MKPQHLTPKQLAVLDGAARGLTDAQIAREHGLSLHTVRSHWQGIKERLGARTRAEAVSKRHLAGESMRQQVGLEKHERDVYTIQAIQRALNALHREEEHLMEALSILTDNLLLEERFMVFRNRRDFLRAAPHVRKWSLPEPGTGLSEARFDGISHEGLDVRAGGEDPYRLVVTDWPGTSFMLDKGPVIIADRPNLRKEGEGDLVFEMPAKVRFFGIKFGVRSRWTRVADVWTVRMEADGIPATTMALSPRSEPGFLGIRTQSDLTRVCLQPSPNSYPMVSEVLLAGQR